jgi:catechol 2,3-dioxygenase-like lactoylglutathione lyase family enzyme
MGDEMVPVTFNHAGIGVADIFAAVAWYGRVFGLKLVREPFEVRSDLEPGGEQACDVLGPDFRRMWMAHMATADGIGLELFQLVEPTHKRREPALEYWKSGVFHLSFTTDDVVALAQRVVEHGGRQRSRVWYNRPPHPTKRMVYLEDPWGTIIELYSHSYEEMYEPGSAAS